MQLKSLEEAKQYLYDRIPQTRKKLFEGPKHLDRTEYLLKLLGDPQNQIPAFHIAGTSGKGSTATLLSYLLKAHGFLVGLHVSPHLLDVRERIQINNELVQEKKYLQYFNEILDKVEQVDASPYGRVTYFELNTVLAYYIFAKEKLNFMVIETGLGGLSDSTNTITNPSKIAIITRLGFDHTQILGNTLPQIAFQKAGIIQLGNAVISLKQYKTAQQVIDTTIQEKASQGFVIQPGVNYRDIRLSLEKTTFSFSFQSYSLSDLNLALIGEHQAENASIALAALIVASQQYNFDLLETKIRKTLQGVTFPGRFDVKQLQDHTFIADGAHNPQKIAQLVKTLRELFPNQKFTFILSIKKTKSVTSMVKNLLPVAKRVIVTDYHVHHQEFLPASVQPEKIGKKFTELGFNSFELISDKKKALSTALGTNSVVIATGSLYFMSELYPILKEQYGV
jgi:dihydrofolate synthase / folylpolyglutamate synthase